MNKKTIILSAAAVLFLGGIFVTNAYVYRGDPNVTGPNYSPERHALMTKAFENSDYSAWKNLMSDRGNTRVLEVVDEGNFDKFVQIHNLMADGKVKEAQELRTELGLGMRKGLGNGQRGNGPKDGTGFGRNR